MPRARRWRLPLAVALPDWMRGAQGLAEAAGCLEIHGRARRPSLFPAAPDFSPTRTGRGIALGMISRGVFGNVGGRFVH